MLLWCGFGSLATAKTLLTAGADCRGLSAKVAAPTSAQVVSGFALTFIMHPKRAIAVLMSCHLFCPGFGATLVDEGPAESSWQHIAAVAVVERV
jgi:hypothetical protein